MGVIRVGGWRVHDVHESPHKSEEVCVCTREKNGYDSSVSPDG